MHYTVYDDECTNKVANAEKTACADVLVIKEPHWLRKNNLFQICQHGKGTYYSVWKRIIFMTDDGPLKRPLKG